MHIPDGFLDTRTVAATSVLSVVAVGAALRHTSRAMPPRSVPMMGLMAAVVFAGQMINFPIAAGTSGHLLERQRIRRPNYTGIFACIDDVQKVAGGCRSRDDL